MKRILSWCIALLSLFIVGEAWSAGLPPTVGFHAEVEKFVPVKQTGWAQVTGFRTSGLSGLRDRGFFNNGTAFNPTTGEFTAPADGYYLFSANVRLDGAQQGTGDRYLRAVIAVNGNKDINNGSHVILGSPSGSNFRVLPVEGVIKLKKNDKVTLWVYSNVDNDYVVQVETSFSGMSLGNAIQHGYHADLSTDKAIAAKGWQQVTAAWRTSGSAGLYKQGTGFDAGKGEFTAPEAGTYYLSARVRIDKANSGIFQLHLATGSRDPKNGLIATGPQNTSTYTYFSLSVSGIVKLTKGEKVTLWVFSESDTSYTIQHESGMSGILLSNTPRLGFMARLDKPVSYGAVFLNGLNYPLGNWITSGSKGLFSEGAGFDTKSGTYTFQRTGYYYVSGLVRAGKHSGRGATLRAFVSINGVVSGRIGISNVLGGPPTTLTYGFHGVLRAKKGDSIKLLFGKHWWAAEVHPETSWSLYIIGGDDFDQDGASTTTDCDDLDKSIALGKPELCDNKDNDCNGKVDDIGGACTVSGVKAPCAAGEWSCGRGLYKFCKQKVFSQIETCDGKDNNCDGVIDNVEGLGQKCQDPAKKGLCSEGVWQCVTNKKTCVTQTKPAAEVCDGKDNDCDGKVDNLPDLGNACTDSGRKGICVPGTWLCQNNKKVCLPLQVPTTETCDGKDEDCDGQIDNIPDAGKACQDPSRLGECKAGTWSCQGTTKICKATNQPGTETCDGKDNDCDGKVDNVADLGKACSDNTRKGPCQAGVWACANNTKVCQASVKPSAEVCDQKDNDCDGLVDNGVCGNEPPDGGNPEPAGCGQGCPPGQVCVGNACKPHPCEGVTCKEGEFCRDGQCVPSCGCIECPAGNVCLDGKCHADSCAGVSCAKGEVCSPDTGQCVSDGCQGKTCTGGEVCQAGVCVQEPCLLVKCGAKQACVNGQCYDNGCEPGKTRTTVDPKLPAGPSPVSGAGCSIQPVEESSSNLPFLLFLGLLILVVSRRRS